MSTDKTTTSVLPLHFNGRNVRVHLDDTGLPWWVAQDVGAILDLRNVRKSLAQFPENEKGVTSSYTPGGIQSLITVNEPGLYRLIFQSRKPEAEAFKVWVFHDILPALRRTGTYTVPSQAPITTLTPDGYLPPPQRAQREHAEVSWHLLAVFRILKDHDEWLSNQEIAQRTGIAARTARAHTLYLLQLGLIERQEYFPRHLYHFSPQAERRNAGVYLRLTDMVSVIQDRQKF